MFFVQNIYYVLFWFFSPQREETLKQHKELSLELIHLRGELGKHMFGFFCGGNLNKNVAAKLN